MSGAPLRLLHVFSTFATGGPQVRFAALANRFAATHAHVIVAMDGAYDAGVLLRPDVAWRERRLLVDKRRTLHNRALFRRIVREERPDTLVTYNWGATEWGLANLPRLTRHVHVEDGFGPEEAGGQLLRRVWFRRLALAGAHAVIVPSRTLETIARDVWRLNRRRLVFVPNGIAADRFAATPDRALLVALGLKGAGPLVGTVTALRREKNLARLIRAFGLASAGTDARLVIVGDGVERPGLETIVRAERLAGRVVFTGHLAEPQRLLGALDVYALSSDTEQMPLSLLEAMAAGLPVAATDVGDVRAIVAPQNAPYIVPTDDAALAGALAALLKDAAARAAVGRANAARAREAFAEERMFAAWDAVLRGGRPTDQPA